MAVTTTPLGFKKPDGNELANRGDNVLADNAQTAQDLIAADRGRLGAIEALNVTQGSRLDAAESGITSTSARVSAVESGNAARDSRLTVAESTNTTQDTRIGSFESQILGLSAQIGAVSTPFNIGVDLDGVPYFQDGASGLSLEADTDGVPYFL